MIFKETIEEVRRAEKQIAYDNAVEEVNRLEARAAELYEQVAKLEEYANYEIAKIQLDQARAKLEKREDWQELQHLQNRIAEARETAARKYIGKLED